MVNVWRIYLRKGEHGNSVSISEYCLKNKVAAMGWILTKSAEKIKRGEITINSYSDYESYVTLENYREHNCVKKLAQEIKPGDFIWTYSNFDKKYYLAKVSNDSRYHYNFSDEAVENDACNELTNIDWQEIGDHNVVDEKIVMACQRGQTLRRICDPKTNRGNYLFVLKYTQKIYDKINCA